MISIDWKFVGRDYLGFFPDEYPALAFLQGEAFATLCDEMSNEAADTCFDTLSGFLLAHGYQLWNINSGGDDYNLILVADGDVDAFLAHCAEDATEDFTPECERLAADAPPWVAPPKPKRKAKAKPIALITESDYHSRYGGIGFGTDVYRFVDFEDEDGSTFESLIDCRTFPLKGVDADGLFALIDQKHSLSGIHTTDTGQYWRWEKPQKRQKLYSNRMLTIALATDYQPLVLTEVADMTMRDGDFLGHWGLGNSLYVQTLYEKEEPRFDASAPVIGKPPEKDNPRAAVFQITGLSARHVATVRQQDVIMPLSETELLILMVEDAGYAESSADYVLVDVTSGAVTAPRRLPYRPPSTSDSLHRLNAEEIVYIREEVLPHPTHLHLKEQIGWLVRLNVRTGLWREAKLEGLHNDFTINMAMLRNQAPDRHRIRSFDGFVSFADGHDDWCILNYLTSQSGSHDLAWLWNTRTDDVIKIRQSDFPRRTPTLFFNPTIGSYFADDSCRLDRLIAFDQIAVSRKVDQLLWNS
jgi:hypothetical protein